MISMAVVLDITEVELSVFTKQYLNRRILDLEILRREATAWAQWCNVVQAGVRLAIYHRGCLDQAQATLSAI